VITAVLVLMMIVGVVLFIGSLSGGGVHTLWASFDSTTQITGGQRVRVAGRPVGTVGEIKLVDGQPVVALNISDSSVWPLPQGTRAQIRWGSTTSYLLRYIDLGPGTSSM
jgi:phospholipid/cholesterol/gamma-HCH transport system substrate-binding protein